MTRILIADDSPIDQQLAGALLRKHLKADVSFACDGVEALEQVNLHAPDLLLTDMQMPRINGLELVASLKDKHPMIPVILMTAAGSEAIAVKAITAGAASYVSKRSLAADLCDTVPKFWRSRVNNGPNTACFNGNSAGRPSSLWRMI